MIGIIDYSLGNIQNVKNALDELGYPSLFSSDYEVLKACDTILLPGVGHFGHAMAHIETSGLKPTLLKLAESKPLIGICLGMQLLFERSTEGNVNGLGLLPGDIVRMETEHPVPHLGWNTLSSRSQVLDGKDVYFIHSYIATRTDTVIATSEYGIDIPAVVKKGHITGIQFHPEKSGRAGLEILRQAIEGGI